MEEPPVENRCAILSLSLSNVTMGTGTDARQLFRDMTFFFLLQRRRLVSGPDRRYRAQLDVGARGR